MSHSKFRQALFLVTVLSTLAGCSDGGNNNNGAAIVVTPPLPDPDPEPQPQTDFSTFVIGLFANTADNTDPVPVNGLDFSFADQDNPAAFDELLE